MRIKAVNNDKYTIIPPIIATQVIIGGNKENNQNYVFKQRKRYLPAGLFQSMLDEELEKIR